MTPRLTAPLLVALFLILSLTQLHAQVVPDLYRVEAQAGHEGWTASLRQQAGNLRYQMGDFEAAIAHWHAALLLDPQNVPLLRQLAELYISRQRWADAIDLLKQLSDLSPDDRWVHYQLGLILAPTNPIEAQTHLQFSREIDLSDVLFPSDLSQPFRVGLALANAELWPYAERAFQQVSALGFTEATAYVGLARDMQGKDGEAWIQQAVLLEPENPRVHYVEGLHLRFKGDSVGSWSAFAHALQLDPLNPAYTAELGTAYYHLDDLASAEYWLRQAVELSRQDPLFVEQLNLFYASAAPSLPLFGINPQQQIAQAGADVKAEYGWSLHLANQTDAGLAEIEAALQLEPRNPRTLYYKARILIDTGRIEEAKPLLQQVIDSGSEFSEEARRIFENLD